MPSLDAPVSGFNEATAISCGDHGHASPRTRPESGFNEATAISCGDRRRAPRCGGMRCRFNEATAISCGDPLMSSISATSEVRLQRGHSD